MKEPTAPYKLTPIPLIKKRHWILNRVKGKSVLHAGPTDYPLTASKIQRGELLHFHLMAACRELLGVDLAHSAIELLRTDHGVDNILHGNIEEIDRIIGPRKFEVIIAGDVIEHINNVGLFFQAAHNVLVPEGEIIITVPNAFSLKKVLGALIFRQERNHPDHMYYFTPMSLHQAAYRFGYDIVEMASFMSESPERPENRFANLFIRTTMALFRNHHIADELAVVLRPLS